MKSQNGTKFPPRLYTIFGVEIISSVLKFELQPNGTVRFQVHTCPPSGSTTTSWREIPDDDSLPAALEKIRSTLAYAAAKAELGVYEPGINVYLLNPEDPKPVNICHWAHVDLSEEVTRVESEYLPKLPLLKTGNAEIQTVRHTYEALLDFPGKRMLAPITAADNLDASCVIGREVVISMLDNDRAYLHDLFRTETQRALNCIERNRRKTVVILADYENLLEHNVLKEVMAPLRRRRYDVQITGDGYNFEEQTDHERMLLYGSLCRFVICVEPLCTARLTELETCARAGFVTAVLRPDQDCVPTADRILGWSPGTMKLFRYGKFDEVVASAAAWAEATVLARHSAKTYH